MRKFSSIKGKIMIKHLVYGVLFSFVNIAQAHDIAIEVGDYQSWKGNLFNVQAKYYQRFVNDTKNEQIYCYNLSLCIENFGCAKPFSECVRVNPESERLIGKELHYVRTIDYPGRYEVIATSRIEPDQIYTRHSHLDIW